MSVVVDRRRHPTGSLPARDRRASRAERTWVAAAGLLLAAGLSGTAATAVHWSGCGPAALTLGCRDLQDRTGSLPLLAPGDPWVVLLLGGICALAVTLAWGSVVAVARLRPTLTVGAVVVGLQPALASLTTFTGDTLPATLGAVVHSVWFYLVPDVVALVFAGLVLMQDDVLGGLDRLRWVLLAVAVTAFGPVAGLVENLVLAYRHPETADTVPGAGYGVAGLLLAVALVLLATTTVATVRRRRTAAQAAERAAAARRPRVRVVGVPPARSLRSAALR